VIVLASENVRNDTVFPEFHGHYVDDAALLLEARPATPPAASVERAHVSPELPAGVAYLTGVTQFIVAELSMGGPTVTVAVECTASNGGACPNFEPLATPLPGSPPYRSEVPLPLLMPADRYAFTLRAQAGSTLSAAYPLTAELRAGVGELYCERSTNGGFGALEVRHMGLRLRKPDGTPVPGADYHLYERTLGQGWVPFRTFTGGVPLVHLSFPALEFDSGRNFLAIAVDRETSTAVAAREFFWGQPPSVPTQGCRVCDMSATGDCTVIPLL
jgi:hypothetical protein